MNNWNSSKNDDSTKSGTSREFATYVLPFYSYSSFARVLSQRIFLRLDFEFDQQHPRKEDERWKRKWDIDRYMDR